MKKYLSLRICVPFLILPFPHHLQSKTGKWKEGAYLMFTLSNPGKLFQIIPFPQDFKIPHQEASLPNISVIVSTGNWWMLRCREMLRNTGFKQNPAGTTFYHLQPGPGYQQDLRPSIAFLCTIRVHRSEKWLFPEGKHLPAKNIVVYDLTKIMSIVFPASFMVNY